MTTNYIIAFEHYSLYNATDYNDIFIMCIFLNRVDETNHTNILNFLNSSPDMTKSAGLNFCIADYHLHVI
jgi:hypothetical protein